MISAVFDESGHSANTDFVTMAGFVAPDEQWLALASSWNELLVRNELSEWHSSDYANSINEYKRWKGDEEGRRKLYGEFMGLIFDTGGVPLGATVSMVHWRQMSDVVKRLLMNPYYLTLELCLHRSNDYRAGMFREEKMRIVFDDNREFKRRIPKLYRALRDNLPEGVQLLESPSFVSADNSAQMQVADLVAYEVRQFHHNHLNRPGDDPRWGYKRLVEMVLRSCKFGPVPWFWHVEKEALEGLQRSVLQSLISNELSGLPEKGVC